MDIFREMSRREESWSMKKWEWERVIGREKGERERERQREKGREIERERERDREREIKGNCVYICNGKKVDLTISYWFYWNQNFWGFK